MDKTFTVADNPGEAKTENYTIRVCVPKSILRQACGTSWNEEIRKLFTPISFDQGILAGMANTFKLSVESDLSYVSVSYPRKVMKSKIEQVEVSEMKISFIADGIVRHSDKMSKEHKYFYFFIKKTDPYWEDSVNELKIDITVTQLKKLEFVMSETSSPLSAINNHNRGFMDVSAYFMSEDLSDISVKCGTKQFPAHLFVLGYNSEVFTKMFEHEMKEKKTRSVEIKDFSPNAVIEMLRYFYTSKVENLDNVVAFQLYELGDRYMVETLKKLVADFLGKTVNMDNALEMYYFSRKHNIDFLTEVVKGVLYKKELIKNYNGLLAFMESVPSGAVDELFNLLMG